MNIYKLNYTDKEAAIIDLIKKGVYIELEDLNKLKYLNYGDGIKAIVEIGKIVLENGVYDAEFKELKPPVYADGYAYDVMSEIEYKFDNEIFPTTPMHNFAGCEPIKEIKDEPTAI
jgi:hypothetical protein